MDGQLRRWVGLSLLATVLSGIAFFWSGRQAAAITSLGRRYVFASIGLTTADTLRISVTNPVINSITGDPNVRGTIRVTLFDVDGAVLDTEDRQVTPGSTAFVDVVGSDLIKSGRAQVRAEVTFRSVKATPSPFPLAVETPALELFDSASGRTLVLNPNPKLIGGG